MRKRVRYRGTVQGVGFRATAHRIAAVYSVAGWVENDSDGSVLLEAQADRDRLLRFLDEVEEELGSYIRAVSTSDIADEAEEREFRVRTGG